jgi:hypothetical protein
VSEKQKQVVEFIEIAVVELRGIAQPRDLAELRTLALEAEEAENDQQLDAILEQAENLRRFCESRKASALRTPMQSYPPPGRKGKD